MGSTYAAMIEGATKMPEPMTLPTMIVVASNSPRPRTSWGAGRSPAGADVALTRVLPSRSARASCGSSRRFENR